MTQNRFGNQKVEYLYHLTAKVEQVDYINDDLDQDGEIFVTIAEVVKGDSSYVGESFYISEEYYQEGASIDLEIVKFEDVDTLRITLDEYGK